MNLSQLQQPPKVYLTVMLVLCIISISSAFQYFFKPLLSKRAIIISEFTLATDQIAQGQNAQLPSLLRSKQNNVHSLLTQLKNESEQRSKGEVIPQVLVALDKISENHDIKLTGVDPLSSKRINSFDQLEFDIRLNGSYKNIFAWLSETESALQPISVERIQIMPSRISGEVSVQMKTISYLFPNQEND